MPTKEAKTRVEPSVDLGLKTTLSKDDADYAANYPYGHPDEKIIVIDGTIEVDVSGKYGPSDALSLAKRISNAAAAIA
jgi:hypothetical protein